MKKILSYCKNFFKIRRYGILEYQLYGEEKYIAIYKEKSTWKALPKDIPDIVNELLTTTDVSRYKRHIYDKDMHYWSLWDTNIKTEISDNARTYCSLKTKNEAYDLIEKHKEFLNFKKNAESTARIIEYVG